MFDAFGVEADFEILMLGELDLAGLSGASHAGDILFLGHGDFPFSALSGFAVVEGELEGVLNGFCVWRGCLDSSEDDVGAGAVRGVKPPIIAVGMSEREALIVLSIPSYPDG